MKANIVVDLGFGDSGKGAAVDSLCLGANLPVVVRFSGGQQCGHSVHLNETLNHVHSSYGSGTLRGVPSYFTEHTTMYLVSIAREHQELAQKGIVNPSLTFHPLAKVTTPYDVAYNRVTAGLTNHGTVGLGVGATMTRNLTGYKLHVVDFSNEDIFQVKLNSIRTYYSELLSTNYGSFLSSYIIKQFNEEVNTQMPEFMAAYERIGELLSIDDYSYLEENFQDIIFEGSQGILLDMDHGTFPNVTYANTTSKNALEVCRKLNIPNHAIEFYYVARAYLTRHGNGWLPEGENVELINNEHEINVTNHWQGDFKTRPFNLDLLMYALGIDQIYTGTDPKLQRNLIISCCDQISVADFDLMDSINLESVFANIVYRYSPISSPLWQENETF